MFRSLFGSLLSHLYQYANENISVKYLSLICITSILTTIYLLKNCSVYGRSCRIYCPKSFAFFRIEFRQVKKKNVIRQSRSVHNGKNCVRGLECRPPPTASGGTQDRGHSFSQYGPPVWRITCNYCVNI